MKKLITLFCALMAASCLFAAGAKWKSSDIYHQKKFDKLIDTYKLTKTYEDERAQVYKNEEGSDWVYIYREGSAEKKDKSLFFVAFANLGGVFDSCTIYGGWTDYSDNVKYIYSYINESNTAIQDGDFMGKASNWVWGDPFSVYYMMFRVRDYVFTQMYNNKDAVGIGTIPEKTLDKYVFFNKWIGEHKDDKDVQKEVAGEYKKYLKEHK